MPAAFEIIDQVDDQVRGARLPREPKVLARQHVTVETEAQFHWCTFATIRKSPGLDGFLQFHRFVARGTEMAQTKSN